MTRQIVLDTETTGLGADKGHKIIEIGCVEILNRKLTGKNYHVYINPQRNIDNGAFRVHGISNEFLQNKPIFKDIVIEFLDFITGAELLIHNAPFDVGFLNAELKYIKWKKNLEHYCGVFDTLLLARSKHPGQRNTLDALCKRYEIDNSKRNLHGALLDAQILALVYLAMTGGQHQLFDEVDSVATKTKIKTQGTLSLNLNNAVIIRANPEELALHEEFTNLLIKKSGKNYWEE